MYAFTSFNWQITLTVSFKKIGCLGMILEASG